MLSITNKICSFLFHSTAPRPEVGCRKERRGEKRALLFSPEHTLVTNVWPVAGHLPVGDDCARPCMLGSRAWVNGGCFSVQPPWCFLLVYGSHMSTAPPLTRPHASLNLLARLIGVTSQRNGKKGTDEASRVGHLGSLPTFLFIFPLPCSFQAF